MLIKCCAKTEISSTRSRRAGTVSCRLEILKNKSFLKFPFCTSARILGPAIEISRAVRSLGSPNVWSTRSCAAGLRSDTPSKINVPDPALWIASVIADWLSVISGCRTTIGRSARVEKLCRLAAINDLPVPGSPKTKTGAAAFIARAINRYRFCMAGDCPTRGISASGLVESAAADCAGCRRSKALADLRINSGRSNGLGR